MYCGLHKQQGMVDVKHKRDRSHLAAGKQIAFAVRLHLCRAAFGKAGAHACRVQTSPLVKI